MSSRPHVGNIILTAGDNLTFDATRGAFTKTFPANYTSAGDRIGLLNATLYYSWNNLTTTFNNLSGCSYIWTNGVTYPVVFPAGFYSIADLNGYLQYTMKTNGHYLVNDTGQEVYYLSLQVNPVYYAVTLTSTVTPSALPANWTNPGGMAFNHLTPQLVVSGATNWYKLIGFAAGTYPAVQGTTTQQINGTLIPAISPVTSVLMLCDWVSDGRFTSRPSVIASFTPNVGFGQLINFTPVTVMYYDVIPRNYTGITVQFVDQNFVPLAIQDTSQTVLNFAILSAS